MWSSSGAISRATVRTEREAVGDGTTNREAVARASDCAGVEKRCVGQ